MRVAGVRFVQGRNRYGTSTKYAIAVHATANTASAANEAAYATRRTDGTSSHFYADNVEVVQSLDTADRAGHAGSTQGNTYAIAVEFTGLTSWSRAKWLSSVAWDRIGAVLATVSRHHNIPATRATVAQMKANARARGAYDHNQMRLAWGGTDHTDPGPNFPWDELLRVWQRHLGQAPQQEDFMSALTDEQQKQLYTWVKDLSFILWRGGPGNKTDFRSYFANIEVKLNALDKELDLLAARADIDPAELAAIRAEMRAELEAHEASFARSVAEQTVDLLGAGEQTPEEIAQLLRAALGDKAASVGALLTAQG